MQSWNLRTVGVEPHEPEILSSGKDARMILLHLPAGEVLQEHEVHERARVIIIEGEVDTSMPSGESVSGGPGHLFEFQPGERHTVAARSDSRLLLILSPWPGDGHPGAIDPRGEGQGSRESRRARRIERGLSGRAVAGSNPASPINWSTDHRLDERFSDPETEPGSWKFEPVVRPRSHSR